MLRRFRLASPLALAALAHGISGALDFEALHPREVAFRFDAGQTARDDDTRLRTRVTEWVRDFIAVPAWVFGGGYRFVRMRFRLVAAGCASVGARFNLRPSSTASVGGRFRVVIPEDPR